MTSSNAARNRGKAEERRIAKAFGTNRSSQMGKATSDLDPAFDLSVSVKNSVRLGILGRWISEAEEFGRKEKKDWILVVRRKAKKKATVTCDLDYFLKLYE